MNAAKFRLEVSYDESTGDPVAAYVRIREGRVARTIEICEGVAFADFTGDGELLGIELLTPSRMDFLDRILESETEPVRRFLRRGLLKEMIVT